MATEAQLLPPDYKELSNPPFIPSTVQYRVINAGLIHVEGRYVFLMTHPENGRKVPTKPLSPDPRRRENWNIAPPAPYIPVRQSQANYLYPGLKFYGKSPFRSLPCREHVSLGGLEQYIKGELCLLLAGLDLGPVEKDYDSRIGRSVSKYAQKVEKGLHEAFNPGYIQTVWAPKFRLFSELPIELRLEIWQFSLPRKRILEIKKVKEAYRWGKDFMDGFGVPDSIPATLHVCRESREEGLRFYRPSFGRSYGSATTYFDPTFDTIFFRHENITELDFLSFLRNSSNVRMITSIAFCTEFCQSFINLNKYGSFNDDFASFKEIFCNISSAYCSNHAEGLLEKKLKLKKCRCEAKEWLSEDDQQKLKDLLGVRLVRVPIAAVTGA